MRLKDKVIIITGATSGIGKAIAMDEGLRFAIREGGRTVGAGRVIKILK